ncbi:MAG: CHASE2 domain-containing protein [Leptolyngbyaceae cyanobacterium SL_7_1]|nr:CHASE2 domain-containing protein [Leptolyngbyaceae cyanobacterium SL_7_1]
MTSSEPLRLTIQQVEKLCLFQLSWGRGQQLTATLPYPPLLTSLYQEWRRVYLSFYETAQIPNPLVSTPNAPLRGRAAESGSISTPAIDWHARLVEAEAKLLYEFHRWLRGAELFEIRAQIAQATQESTERGQYTDVFLACTPVALARFPWEAWEIGNEFGSTGTVRIVRTPANIRCETNQRRSHRHRARILAILGDDTGLNFRIDQAAVNSLARVAEVRFVGWQPGQSATEVKDQISQAIADEAGWDVLFFAGHSNETQITGGELAIAPGASLRINEIAPQLTIAKDNGLQFAIFNSCSGLSIAESLINLGLCQVAVMREPIHNQVAQEFLVRFLQNLAAHRDVHASLLTACQFLQLEKNFTFPSAHLLPSLFRHPDAPLFRIEPVGWRQRLQVIAPTRWQAIAVATTVLLSLYAPVQDLLLDRRLGVQAAYRDFTQQVPPPTEPPVTLVQIDDVSIQRSPILGTPTPINREYLASLVDALAARNTQLVGIDYLLDRQQPGKDQILGRAVRSAVAEQGTVFVFGAIKTFTDPESGVVPASQIVDLNWSAEGLINAFPTHLTLPTTVDQCATVCPFSYLLSLIYATYFDRAIANPPRPQLSSTTHWRTQLLEFVETTVPSDHLAAVLRRSHYHPMTNWSRTIDQLWLRPVIDYSVPADRAYRRVSAWQLLEENSPDLADLSQQIVIIAPGGYGGAGIDGKSDTFPMPTAMAYWRDRLFPNQPPFLTGAEAHAYMSYHLLSQRWVVPIPDLWMVGVAILVGKGTAMRFAHHQRRGQWSQNRRFYSALGASGGSIGYGLLGLQLFTSLGVLFPWVLPTVIFWVYILPMLRKKPNA